MNREEFEQLREKKKKRLGFIKLSVWGVCYFCGAITLGYLLYGTKRTVPSPNGIPVSKQTEFGAVEAATPTPELKGNTRNEPDLSDNGR